MVLTTPARGAQSLPPETAATAQLGAPHRGTELIAPGECGEWDILDSRRESRTAFARQARETRTTIVRSFVATLRGTIPARQSLASSRKRVLRPPWQRAGRSVNSQSPSRAIEPRKLDLFVRGRAWGL